jgi:hypothetical protein
VDRGGRYPRSMSTEVRAALVCLCV